MNVLLLTSHSIAEYDDLRMLTDLGYDVFSIGAYTDPTSPTDDKRPALDVPFYHELAAACDKQRNAMAALWGDPGRGIDWAKARLAPEVIDWAETIIVHHFPESWIGGQWDAIRHKRVIWRTCGQSSPDGSLEYLMAPLRDEGLEIVRYSPRERVIPNFAGEDALIRFGKYPADYGPWECQWKRVGNITQNMAQRGDACGFRFWLGSTVGLATLPAGPGSEVMADGMGTLPYERMLGYLRGIRVYLYTGTRPASYTLGLIEAMLSGTPVVSIPARAWGDGWGGMDLFEADEIVGFSGDASDGHVRDLDQLMANTREMLSDIIRFDERAANHSAEMRRRALELFDVAVVGPQWKAFLG